MRTRAGARSTAGSARLQVAISGTHLECQTLFFVGGKGRQQPKRLTRFRRRIRHRLLPGRRQGDDGTSGNFSSGDGNTERLGPGLRQKYAKRGKWVGEDGERDDV